MFVHSGPEEADSVCERMEKEKKNGKETLRIVDFFFFLFFLAFIFPFVLLS